MYANYSPFVGRALAGKKVIKLIKKLWFNYVL